MKKRKPKKLPPRYILALQTYPDFSAFSLWRLRAYDRFRPILLKKSVIQNCLASA